MYLYYEHLRSPDGKIILTEMRLSSYGNGSLAISWNIARENTIFLLCKSILKWSPIDKRSYDEDTKVWTYFDNWGIEVIKRLKEVTASIHEIICIEVVDLSIQSRNGRVNLSLKPKMRAEEFFYNHGTAVAAPVLTKEMIAAKLKLLMGESLDKTSYRRAALRYHPDRNNGDGKQMSELNSLWKMYNA